MKITLTYKVALGCLLTFFCYSSYSQNPKITKSANPEIYEANKRASNYQELLNLGYAENEIYEDLGNANFLRPFIIEVRYFLDLKRYHCLFF